MPWGPAPKSSQVHGLQQLSGSGTFPQDRDRLHELKDKLPRWNSAFPALSWAWASICPVLLSAFSLGKKGGSQTKATLWRSSIRSCLLLFLPPRSLNYWLLHWMTGKFLGLEGQENHFSELCVRFPGCDLGWITERRAAQLPAKRCFLPPGTRLARRRSRELMWRHIAPVNASRLISQTAKGYLKKSYCPLGKKTRLIDRC